MTTTAKGTKPTTSDKILDAFDSIVAKGADLPIGELKKRFAGAEYFKHRDHQLFTTVFEIPVTVELITGDTSSAASKILAGLREMYGDSLIFKVEGYGGEVKLKVQMWKDEAALRELWKDFAEDEYKSTMLRAA